MSLHNQCFESSESSHHALRGALGRFATGIAVMTTRTPDGQIKGVTANSFSSVSLDPPLVLWSLRRNAPSLEAFMASRYFAVNVLCADQVGVSRRFAQPHADKFQGVACAPGLGGCPLIEGAL